MKKMLIIILLLGASTISLIAENVVVIQGGYLSTSRVYDIDSVYPDEKFTKTDSEAGVNITAFLGKRIGFYSSVSVLLPFSWTTKGEASGYLPNKEDGNYEELDTKIGIDMLLGVGFLIPAGESLSFILGGGAHYNGLFLDDIYLSESYMSNVLGVGFAANTIIDLSRNIKWNIGITGAWDFVEFISRPELAQLHHKNS